MLCEVANQTLEYEKEIIQSANAMLPVSGIESNVSLFDIIQVHLTKTITKAFVEKNELQSLRYLVILNVVYMLSRRCSLVHHYKISGLHTVIFLIRMHVTISSSISSEKSLESIELINNNIKERVSLKY